MAVERAEEGNRGDVASDRRSVSICRSIKLAVYIFTYIYIYICETYKYMGKDKFG